MAKKKQSPSEKPAPAQTGDILKSWRSRIVEYGKIEAGQVTPHPLNPKIHPYEQQLTTAEILEALGQIGPIIINKANGYLVDGEQRTWLALELKERTGLTVELDVAYVELTEEEHEQALLTFDPVGELARPDPDRLKTLMQKNNALGPNDQKLRDALRQQAGDAPSSGTTPLVYSIMVTFDDAVSFSRAVHLLSYGDMAVPNDATRIVLIGQEYISSWEEAILGDQT